jgi:hypothetical protein
VAVALGDQLVASVELWSDRPAHVRLVLKRGDRGPYEGQVATLALGTEPRRFSASHVFQQPWESVMFGLVAPDQQGVTVFARGFDLRIDPEEPAEEAPGGVLDSAAPAGVGAAAAGVR